MQTINVDEALKRLDAIEKEQKELRQIIEDAGKAPSIYDSPSYETACLINGIDPIQSLPYMDAQTPEQEWHNAAHKLRTIASVLRGDSDKKIYYPVFNVAAGGFSFDDVRGGTWRVDRSAAAGLCLQDEKTAKFFGTQEAFLDIWKVYMLN